MVLKLGQGEVERVEGERRWVLGVNVAGIGEG
jgi:hypothetical protein